MPRSNKKKKVLARKNRMKAIYNPDISEAEKPNTHNEKQEPAQKVNLKQVEKSDRITGEGSCPLRNINYLHFIRECDNPVCQVCENDKSYWQLHYSTLIKTMLPDISKDLGVLVPIMKETRQRLNNSVDNLVKIGNSEFIDSLQSACEFFSEYQKVDYNENFNNISKLGLDEWLKARKKLIRTCISTVSMFNIIRVTQNSYIAAQEKAVDEEIYDEEALPPPDVILKAIRTSNALTVKCVYGQQTEAVFQSEKEKAKFNQLKESVEEKATNETEFNQLKDSVEAKPTNETEFNQLNDSVEEKPTNETELNQQNGPVEEKLTNKTELNQQNESVEEKPTNESSKLSARERLLLPFKNVLGDYNEDSEVEEQSPSSDAVKQVLELTVGSKGKVVVSFLNNPTQFYVQMESQQTFLEEMRQIFQKDAPTPKIVYTGGMYLGRANDMTEWRRCKVQRIFDGKTISQPLYNVHFVDYGDYKLLRIEGLRDIHPYWAVQPVQAVRCNLGNCKAVNFFWDKKHTALMRKIVKDKILEITILSMASVNILTWECDLVFCDNNTSLAHAFEYHDMVKIINTKLVPKISNFDEKKNVIVKEPTGFVVNSISEVFVTHAIHPEKFYVQKVSDAELYESLCKELYSFYENESLESYVVHYPTEGMACAINLRICGGRSNHKYPWQRAVVISVMTKQMVKLFLPDLGSYYLIHYTFLMRLDERFIRYKAMAIECYLVGLGTEKKVWGEDAMNMMNLYITYDTPISMNIKVETINEEQDTVGVWLSLVTENEEKIVNNIVIQIFLSAAVKLQTLPNFDVPDYMFKLNELPSDYAENFNIRYVTILNFLSPYLFYVFDREKENQIDELYEQIVEYCATNENPANKEFQIGEKCFAFSSTNRCWCRATITQLYDGAIDVFFIDCGFSAIVTMDKVLELPTGTPFSDIPDGAIECHMSGVFPSSEERWTNTVSDMINFIINSNYEYYFVVIKEKHLDLPSLSVDLCGIWLHDTGKRECHCFNFDIIMGEYTEYDYRQKLLYDILDEPEENDDNDEHYLCYFEDL